VNRGRSWGCKEAYGFYNSRDHVLKDLVQGGLLTGYGPLIEEEHGLVAQAENSILVDEKGGVLVTTRI